MLRFTPFSGEPRTIVGVVGDVRHERIDETAMPQVYGPERQWQFADQFLTMVVRTERDPMSLASSIREAVWSVDRSVPISRVAPMRQVIATTTAVRRFAMTIFAVLCALLFPLLHTGRPWFFWWMIPHPNDMSMWPQFRSPLIYILVIATAVTAVLGEYIDAGVIAAVLAINAAIYWPLFRRARKVSGPKNP